MPKVCVIDDDCGSTRALSKIFTSLNGFEVCAEIETVDEAVKEVGSRSPDLIMVGLPLPNDTLAQFVSNLKKLAPNTNICLLIRKCNSVVEKQALSVGITAVFSKFDDYEGLILNAEALFNPKLVTKAKAKTNSLQ